MRLIAETTDGHSRATSLDEYLESEQLQAFVEPNPDEVPIVTGERILTIDNRGRIRIFFDDLENLTCLIRCMGLFNFRPVGLMD